MWSFTFPAACTDPKHLNEFWRKSQQCPFIYFLKLFYKRNVFILFFVTSKKHSTLAVSEQDSESGVTAACWNTSLRPWHRLSQRQEGTFPVFQADDHLMISQWIILFCNKIGLRNIVIQYWYHDKFCHDTFLLWYLFIKLILKITNTISSVSY